MHARQEVDTGGCFSVGYDCIDSEKRAAFLKAIDLYSPMMARGGDVIKVLQPFLQEVQCERELLETCRRMDRVVTAIGGGDLRELNGQQLLIPVPYIIFEQAESTARRIVFGEKRPTYAWCFRTLHQVAVGLWQLHGSMIAHMDLKLSNVLVFKDGIGSKIADLGRSVQQGRNVPHDQLDWPGDNSYAPPEYAYGYTPSEFHTRRFAADLFLLGSCATAIFSGAPMSTLLFAEVPKDLQPKRNGGPFVGTFSDALPYLKDSYERVLRRLRELVDLEEPHRSRVVEMIRQWCEPDPNERGDPRTRSVSRGAGNPCSLERYLSALDLLALRLDYDARVIPRR